MSCRTLLLMAACLLAVPAACIAASPGIVAINHASGDIPHVFNYEYKNLKEHHQWQSSRGRKQ